MGAFVEGIGIKPVSGGKMQALARCLPPGGRHARIGALVCGLAIRIADDAIH